MLILELIELFPFTRLNLQRSKRGLKIPITGEVEEKGLFKMTAACIPPDVFRNPLCDFDETWCVISIWP